MKSTKKGLKVFSRVGSAMPRPLLGDRPTASPTQLVMESGTCTLSVSSPDGSLRKEGQPGAVIWGCAAAAQWELRNPATWPWVLGRRLAVPLSSTCTLHPLLRSLTQVASLGNGTLSCRIWASILASVRVTGVTMATIQAQHLPFGRTFISSGWSWPIVLCMPSASQPACQSARHPPTHPEEHPHFLAWLPCPIRACGALLPVCVIFQACRDHYKSCTWD